MQKAAQFEAVNPDISLAAVHDRMVVFAQDEQGHLMHVDGARRGKACNCRCLACGEALIARQGEIKAHSFAHESGTECQYAIDAMLNRLAKELIAARGCFSTPALTVAASRVGPLGAIKCEETIPSRRLAVESVAIDRRVHRQRPSVVMLVKGRELILEVTHAHRLDPHKRAAIEKLGAWSTLKPMSPRKYQLEPTSVTGLWPSGNVIDGGAVPNRSAPSVGDDAIARPASAAAIEVFIGSFPVRRRGESRSPMGKLGRQSLISD